VLAERARIAREIHDTLLQSLVGVAVQFKTLSMEVESSPETAGDHLTALRRQIEMYIREARRSIWDLRSPALEQTGLAAALRKTAERVVNGTSVQFDYQVTGAPRLCPPRIEEQLLRIGQEAISNVVRHADATCVRVTLAYGDHDLTLRIVDDGRGFDPDTPSSQVHWGLAIMNERAQMIGGRLEVVSSPGSGTAVELVVSTGSVPTAGTGESIPDWPGSATVSTPGAHDG
jgi:signal transduction histidine kinase